MLDLANKNVMRLYFALRWRAKRLFRAIPETASRWRRLLVTLAFYTKLSKKLLPATALKIKAKEALSSNVLEAADLAQRVLETAPSVDNMRWACMMLWNAGQICEAHRILSAIPEARLTAAEKERALQIRGAFELYTNAPVIPNCPQVKNYTPIARRIMYVASSSQPYHISGYTTRTHHLLQALKNAGWIMHCVTRPGYPMDRPDAQGIDSPVVNSVDGVVYERVFGKHRREVQYDLYIQEAAAALITAAIRIKPAVIHAASNYEAGLPALIAARYLGIPFCYEVRGLWEYTAASKKPGWEHTERFDLDRMMEAHVAKNADQVFTLTRALANELVHRGVSETRIELLPNAVDLEHFKPRLRDDCLAEELGIGRDTFICGYIGSIVKYEGLDDLLTAFRAVADKIKNAKLLIVGAGNELPALYQRAERLGLASHVVFTGRVPHAEVLRYFSLLDVVVLPRKPYAVCKLVSPLKPFEAMAMRLPLIVSDVDALSEMFEHGETALIHEAGDHESLADAIIKLAENPSLRSYLSENAFKQVRPNSQWNKVVMPVSEFYGRTST